MIGREKFAIALTKFRTELESRIRSITNAAAKPEEVGANAHKLVGTAGMLGFKQLSERSSALELAICRGATDLAPLVSAVREAADNALTELESLCSS